MCEVGNQCNMHAAVTPQNSQAANPKGLFNITQLKNCHAIKVEIW